MWLTSLRQSRRPGGTSGVAGRIGAWAIADGETNTTDLIGAWSMDGVGSLEHFGSPTNALVLATAECARQCGTAYEAPILVKRPEDASWLPLGDSEDDVTHASDVARRLAVY